MWHVEEIDGLKHRGTQGRVESVVWLQMDSSSESESEFAQYAVWLRHLRFGVVAESSERVPDVHGLLSASLEDALALPLKPSIWRNVRFSAQSCNELLILTS